MNVNYVEKFFVLNLIKLSGIMDVIKVENRYIKFKCWGKNMVVIF